MYIPATRRAAVAVLTLLAGAGCSDVPTTPATLRQIAGGQAWIAIPEPAALPSLDALLPYVGPEGETAPAVARIRALEAEARKARVDGLLDRAVEMDREAARITLASLARMPAPRMLHASIAGLEEWSGRVEAGVDLTVYPEVAGSLREVRHARGAARGALERGDTLAALVRIMDAAGTVRRHAPTAVALRVLGRAESRLREVEAQSATVDRAIHLVRSARLELLAGDASRALRRALYALQLIEGRGVVDVRELVGR